MKEIRKIILIIMFIIISICQTNSVLALSDEIKKEVNYQEGVPDKYDIQIEGSELTADIKIPSISFSLADILYGNEDLLDIDFFDANSKNTDPTWLKIKGIVTNFLRGILYIATAVMLTLLIYMAVNIVIDSISNKNEKAENKTEKRPRRRFKNVVHKLKDKKFVEQWITCFISLALVVVVINILISFSDVLVSTLSFSEPKEQNIKVFVKGGVIAETATSGATTNLIFIGDSRTVQMKGAVSSSYTFIAKSNEKYDYMVNTAFPEANEKIVQGTKVIIWMGVNEYDKTGMIGSYADVINEKAKEWRKKGASIAFATVGPCSQSYAKDNSEIKSFNDGVTGKLSDDIQVIDVYSYMVNAGYNTTDNVHYTNDTYKKVYNYMVDRALNDKGSSYTTKKVQDFSFDTNEEGLFIFQTNYSWINNAALNFRYIIYAGILLVCRTVVFGIYIIRMFLVGLIIIISPILIIINALRVVKGDKGFLKKWVILFLYLIIFNVILKIIFDIFASLNLYSAVKHPIYVVVVHTVILNVAIISAIKMFKFFFGIGRKKK